MSETEIAKALGVSRPTVNNWVNGISKPDVKQIFSLGQLMHRDWKELVGVVFEIEDPSQGLDPDLAVLLDRARALTPSERKRLIAVTNSMFPPPGRKG